MINKLFISISISVLGFVNFAHADSIPFRVEQFSEQFNSIDVVKTYDIRVLQSDYPTKLVSPQSMLPQTAQYPLKDIQLLYQLAQQCKGPLPLSPLVSEPLVFTRAICRGTTLSAMWFARSGLIHPGGGTYAARYAEHHPEMSESLDRYMHIKEREQAESDSLLFRLQRMDDDALNALISGASMFIEANELWLRRGDYYFVFPQDVWKANALALDLSFQLVSEGTECFVRRGNICWTMEDQSELFRNVMILLIVVNILLAGGWGISRWKARREELQSRMLVLQILTHELRTPIASLSLTVEGFRREFEHLPESVYDEFRRLCEDSRRLRQLADASKDYLQSEKKTLSTGWVPSIREWLEYKVEDEFEGKVTLSLNQDKAVKINVYWLGTCIENLIKNAIKYGVSPVELIVEVNNRNLTIKVKDNGNLSRRHWSKIKKPFVSKSGLGLGLTIVDSMVKRMDGRLSLVGPPTMFIMEIPCETDTAAH